jgi:hypothetical protein
MILRFILGLLKATPMLKRHGLGVYRGLAAPAAVRTDSDLGVVCRHFETPTRHSVNV